MKIISLLITACIFFSIIDEARAQSCTLDGIELAQGESATFYRRNFVPISWGQTCEAYAITRYCQISGVLDGSDLYNLSSCDSEADTTRPVFDSHHPMAGSGRKYELVFNDEFVGAELDRNIWWAQDSIMWLGGYRIPERAVVKNGELVIKNRLGNSDGEGRDLEAHPKMSVCQGGVEVDQVSLQCPSGKSYIHPSNAQSAHIATHERFSYGYYEIMAKVSGGPSIDSAFWLTGGRSESSGESGDAKTRVAAEIDIFETFYYDKSEYGISSNLHLTEFCNYGKSCDDPESANSPFHKLMGHNLEVREGTLLRPGIEPWTPNQADLSNEYHVYGLLWRKDMLVWFVDGVEVRRLDRNTLIERVVNGNETEIVPNTVFDMLEGVSAHVRLSTAMSNFFQGVVNFTPAGETTPYVKPLNKDSWSSEMRVNYLRIFKEVW